MSANLKTWMEEGMRHYAAGDPARALESWYRILELEPQHPAALQYVAFVRQAFRLDAPSPAPAAAPAPAPAPVAAPETTTTTTTPLAALPSFDPSAVVATAVPRAATPLLSIAWAAEAATPDAPTLQFLATELPSRAPTPAPLPQPMMEPPGPAPAPTIASAVEAPIPAPVPVEPPAVIAAPVVSEPVAIKPTATPPMPGPTERKMAPMPPPTAGTATATPASASGLFRPANQQRTGESQSWADVAMDTPAGGSPKAMPAPAAVPLFDVEVDVDVVEVMPVSVPLTAGPPLVDGAVRTSRRFGEDYDAPPAPVASAAVPATLPLPVIALPPTAITELPPLAEPVRAPPPVPADDAGASPWDSHEGPAVAFDVDHVKDARASAFESLLKRASGASVPPVQIARPLAEALDLTPPPHQMLPSPPPATASTPPRQALRTPRADVPVDECEALMTGARELFELGDFSGSLELVEKVLKKQPQHEGARAYLKRNEQTLLKMYESKLGDMQRVPRQLVPPDEVIWMNMHHRAGFILSQVDGSLSYDDILEVSGMDRFDTVRIIADLVGNGIIG
ncbi:MAG: hypothetical protein Q8O67_11500 [Deltaproteobacteria bacterium]|nr:hypothetical protein [Deltaproteobacteria bacterium]